MQNPDLKMESPDLACYSPFLGEVFVERSVFGPGCLQGSELVNIFRGRKARHVWEEAVRCTLYFMWKEDVLCTLYSAPYVRGGCNLYSVLCSLCERRMYPVLCTLYLLWEEGVLPVITATTTTSSTAHHQLWTSHHRAAVWNIFFKSIDERLIKFGRTEKKIQYKWCCNLKPSK